jgi:hypothetical protein
LPWVAHRVLTARVQYGEEACMRGEDGADGGGRGAGEHARTPVSALMTARCRECDRRILSGPGSTGSSARAANLESVRSTVEMWEVVRGALLRDDLGGVVSRVISS